MWFVDESVAISKPNWVGCEEGKIVLGIDVGFVWVFVGFTVGDIVGFLVGDDEGGMEEAMIGHKVELIDGDDVGIIVGIV